MWTAEIVLACALELLSRSADRLPPITLLDTRPADVSADAEAFVRTGETRIYLLTNTPTFTRARRAFNRCGELEALRKVASVVIHEEWHVRHPGDEQGAYVAQLTTLTALGAQPGNPALMEVWRSQRVALARVRERTTAVVATR